MKRAYLANGTIAAPTKSVDATLAVDSTTWNYLNGLLGTSYCYLVIDGVEVVKVQSLKAPNLLLVIRDVENTFRSAWPIGTPIAYGLTQSEIEDAVAFTGVALTLQGNLQYDNTGAITYPPVELIGIGGTDTEGDGWNWTLLDITELGCEGLVTLTPPPIPPQYLPVRICYPPSGPDYRITDTGDYRTYQ